MSLTLRAFVRLAVLVVLAGAGPFLRPIAAAEDAHMSAEERAKVIKYLVESESEFLKSIENLSDEQWKFRPAPGKWSVGEVAEHIVLAERSLFANVEKALAAQPNPDWETKTKGKTEFLERVLVNRTGKAQAPESIVPTGKLSRAEVISQYKQVREKTRKFASTTDLSLKDHTTEHPFAIFNTLNAYQWLIYVPLHNLRHNQQIAEVKANKDFPAR
ncbi:MAG: DinB family protein [Acidobacteriota bacterium]